MDLTTLRQRASRDACVRSRSARSPLLLGVLLLGVLLFSGLLPACKAAPPMAEAAASNDAALTVRVDTVTVDVPHTYSGQVFVEQDVIVAARAAGIVDSLYVNIGSAVKRDAPLALIDSRAQEIELARAEVMLERARNARARALALGDRGGVAQADSERVEEELRDAELTLRRTQRDVELTRVNAPFNGVVIARYVGPQQLVAPGDTLFRVAQAAPLLVRVRVGDTSAKAVKIGDRAVVAASDGSGRTSARVRFAAPVLDPASGTREVILQLSDTRLLSGETVTVELGSVRRRALVVPRAAVSPDGYALVADGTRTTLRPVTLGAELPGNMIEVISGLSVGERLAPPR